MADGLPLGDNTATDAAKNVLTKKYGPLPFWAWLVIVGGTVYVAKKYVSGRNTDTTSNDAATVDGSLPPSGVVTPTTSTGMYGGGSLTSASAGSGSSPIQKSYEDNNGWIGYAISVLGGNNSGGWDAYRIQTALTKFVNGVFLTDPTDKAIVAAALSQAGGPPTAPASSGGTGTPDNGDQSVVELVQRAGHAGIFAVYTDGRVNWIQNPTELRSIITGTRFQNADGSPRLNVLPNSDPIFKRATYGQFSYDDYVAAEKASSQSDPTLNPWTE